MSLGQECVMHPMKPGPDKIVQIIVGFVDQVSLKYILWTD